MEERINNLLHGVTSKDKSKALKTLYTVLTLEGNNVAILNDKYLVVNGEQFTFRIVKNNIVAKRF